MDLFLSKRYFFLFLFIFGELFSSWGAEGQSGRNKRLICKEDVQKYCAKAVNFKECLGSHLKDVSPKCLALAKKTNPCWSELDKLCHSQNPFDFDLPCLFENQDRLSPKCRDRVDKIPRKSPCARDLRVFCSGVDYAEEQECLSKNLAKVSAACVKSLSHRNPCYKEEEKYCKPQNPLVREFECLLKYEAKLSPQCLALVRQERQTPCEADLKKFCPGVDYVKEKGCLAPQEKKVSLECVAHIKKMNPCWENLETLCNAKNPFLDNYTCLIANKGRLAKKCAEKVEKFQRKTPPNSAGGEKKTTI